MGSPAPVNTKAGVVLLAPNVGWTNMPMSNRVSEGLGLPAPLDNDANCAIFGEWWRGAARGATYVIGLTLGTGIGGGVGHRRGNFHRATGRAGGIRPGTHQDHRLPLSSRHLRRPVGVALQSADHA